ncbi:putative tRNA pseudouridine synthase Pus10 [Iris pallida]|uniref:tRNA pseudouridine(55) synthase n=1 Tax=Iris pallida TaxID=29817 RepID=A0AAX6GKB9_IRIPA|nr:putative tRNA pseudouridine synthase Pus10 [Iris pallida]
MEEEVRSIMSSAASSLPPAHAIHDLLSSGVCARCIFRLYGVRGHVYSCSSITDSTLHSFLEEHKSYHCGTAETGFSSNGLVQCSYTSKESDHDKSHCSICLGILQLACDSGQEMGMCKGKKSIEDFTTVIAELIKSENYQIDGFSFEVSVPPVIMANERAIRLYMKRKYNGEDWFKDKLHAEHITVKDALKLSITNALEKRLDVTSGVNSFHIRLAYTHFESSARLQSSLGKDHSCKRRKTAENSCDTSKEQAHNESDAAMLKALNFLQDHAFGESFEVPPHKVQKPCQLAITCSRMPIYIGGRYLKFSRKVSQSRWIIDDERMGESSVEEIVGSNALSVCKGDNYKFHAAGREDIDVRMLGSGRPFLIEVSNARCIPSLVEVQRIAETINNSSEKYVRVRNLKVVGSEVWTLMREGEAEKQKQYVALIWTACPLTEENIQNITSARDMEILQRTPIRVLHRRSPLERKRIIHWMKFERIIGSEQYFLLHLCTQAGTYIKEFVHGDLGRTDPSIGSILGCRAEILQLDVTDVKMDFFD